MVIAEIRTLIHNFYKTIMSRLDTKAYVPANLSHVQLSWKMTSKHYSQEGILSIDIHAQFRDSYEVSDEQKIIIEDYIVSK